MAHPENPATPAASSLEPPAAPLVERSLTSTGESHMAAVSPANTTLGGRTRADQLGFLWSVHQYMNEHIRFADTKAGAIVVFNSGLIAALFAAKVHHWFMQPARAWSVVEVAAICAFALLGVGIFIAGWVIIPRLFNQQQQGFVFWESILGYKSAEQFWTNFDSQAEDGLAEHVAFHLFTLSKVARKKFTCVSLAFWVTFLGALMAAGVLLWS